MAGLSWGDVVRVGRRRRVARVVSRNGHRTLRVLFSDDDTESTLEAVRSAGGRPERFAGRLYLVDVPPAAQVREITAALARADVRSEFSDEADELIAEAWREAVRDGDGVRRTLRLAGVRTSLLGLALGLAAIAALEFSALWGGLGVAAAFVVLVARERRRRTRIGAR